MLCVFAVTSTSRAIIVAPLPSLKHHMAAGAVTGTLVALVQVASHKDDPNNWEFGGTGFAVTIYSFLCGSVGAAAGALLAPGERWRPIPAERLRLGIDYGHQGEGRLYCAVRF